MPPVFSSDLFGGHRLRAMKVVCAWCLQEGKPGDLGEREPLEDHRDQLLEDLPSRSFPDVALLIVVRPDHTALFESLQGLLAGVFDVKVIVDRRTNDRRSVQDATTHDHRRSTRRLRQGRTIGDCTVVRFRPRALAVEQIRHLGKISGFTTRIILSRPISQPSFK